MSSPDELPPPTPEQIGMLLASMKRDGRVQKSVPLTPDLMPKRPLIVTPATLEVAREASAALAGVKRKKAKRLRKRGSNHNNETDALSRPQYQRLVQQGMAAAGLTPARLALKIAEQLEATQTKFFPDGRGTIEERVVPDNDARLRAAKLAHEMLMNATEATPEPEREVDVIRAQIRELSLDELIQRAVLPAGRGDRTPGGRGN